MAALVKLTLAPAIILFCWSAIVPRTDDVPVWPQTTVLNASRSAIASIGLALLPGFIFPPLTLIEAPNN